MFGSGRKIASLTLPNAIYMEFFNLNMVVEYATQECTSVARPERQRRPQGRALAGAAGPSTGKGRGWHGTVHYSIWGDDPYGSEYTIGQESSV